MIENISEKKKINDIEDFEETGNIDTISFDDKNLLGPKPILTKLHYVVGNIICVLITITFLLLLFKSRSIPEYLIGFMGSIIGFYIAKAPYNLS
ncbi:hypothetical protein CMO89_03900 [Candidatus Woesearchaeota archaeon]|nr:hypothetical protein [Candidatus Woesearchaeota archaeon]|tara:strand:+ start:3092 stop:3373 length:282 start_codon:yes stop_codon:yes gene_type:complete